MKNIMVQSILKRLTSLGNAHGSLGKYPQAKALFTQSLMIFKEHYGSEHWLTGAVLNRLGYAEGFLEEYEKVKEHTLEAQAIYNSSILQSDYSSGGHSISAFDNKAEYFFAIF